MGSIHSSQRRTAEFKVREFDSEARGLRKTSDIGRTQQKIYRTHMDGVRRTQKLHCPLRKNVSPSANTVQNLSRQEASRQATDVDVVKANGKFLSRQEPTPNATSSQSKCPRSAMEANIGDTIAVKHRLSDASDAGSPRKKIESQFPREEKGQEGMKHQYIIKPFIPQHAAQFEGGNIWKEVPPPKAYPSSHQVLSFRGEDLPKLPEKRSRCTLCALVRANCSLVKHPSTKGPCQRCLKNHKYCVEGSEKMERSLIRRRQEKSTKEVAEKEGAQ